MTSVLEMPHPLEAELGMAISIGAELFLWSYRTLKYQSI